jgi:beta-glucanase (GH16 family)
MKKIIFSLFFLSVLLRGAVFAQNTTQAIDLETVNPIEKAGWTYIWGDEFDSDTLNWSKWWPQTGTHGTELQYYTPRKENVFVENGALHLKAMLEKLIDTLPYTSGEVFSSIEFGQGHYIEVRCKIPKGRGLWPAFWFWSGHNNTKYQEIDAFEIWSADTRRFLVSNYWQDTMTSKVQIDNKWIRPRDENGRRIDMSDYFLTFATYWDETGVRFLLNNKLVAHFKKNSATDPLPIILNLAVEGGKNQPNTKTFLTADFIIDYVRVYKKQGAQTIIRR